MRALFLLRILIITVIAVLMLFFIPGSVGLNGISSTNVTEAEFIRKHNPIHLVQPEWVNNQTDLTFNWMLAETKALAALVIALWMGSLSVVVWRYRRERKQMNLV